MKDIIHSLRVLHGIIHAWRINRLPLLIERLKNPRAVYLVYTPEHGNLGDHAIAESEIELLTNLEIPFIEYTGRKLQILRDNHCLDVMNGRPILINGGGNLGTLWPSVEHMMQCIVQNNPKSNILILPNTIYYDNTSEDLKELCRSMAIYNAHPHLRIYAREELSYVFMKSVYNNVELVPDMVFRLNKCKDGIKRRGCIICLRSDCEKTLSKETEVIIHDQLHSIFEDDIQLLDMKKQYSIPIDKRMEELDKQYDAFRHAELVVTDRLHGMIFSVITGTPCIVLNSKSSKVSGCYEWIKDLPYICFCEDVSQIISIYESIPQQKWQYDNSKLFPLYEPLKEELLRAIKK